MEPGKSRTVFAPSKVGWLIIAVVLLIVAAVPSYYFYNKYNKAVQSTTPSATNNSDTVKLIEAVGKLIQLPNENPTVATVSDITKLKDQPFFANAQNGDKVLIFTQSKEAILYRPSTNKIINVAPVNLGVSPTVAPTVTPSGNPKPSSSPVLPTTTPASTPTSIPVQ